MDHLQSPRGKAEVINVAAIESVHRRHCGRNLEVMGDNPYEKTAHLGLLSIFFKQSKFLTRLRSSDK